jgi:hypothetical protein
MARAGIKEVCLLAGVDRAHPGRGCEGGESVAIQRMLPGGYGLETFLVVVRLAKGDGGSLCRGYNSGP